ncbi:MAG: aminopeptidase N [Pusillimonas sp.]
MRTDTSPTIRRTDYTPYPYRIPQVDLVFDLAPDLTRVHSRLTVESTHPQPMPLVLNGEALTLESIAINGQVLSLADYTLDDEVLTLHPHHSAFTIDIVSTCRPAENTTLMGLYQSGESLFTQCEAEGFRRITWFADRPDVMSRYTVTLRADPARYPHLLSNGNLLSTETLPDGRQQAIWEDPHPKPCYLFALVAGDFDCREQSITTRSGRTALLQVYSDKGDYDRTAWALECLHRSVTWDETRFNLELDLDRFMIVAARDFNMGAMENKGLNVFNSAYVLADSQTATDATYDAIESVIGHEYFHNWTGNRITCRDWFQLSLKEGLTVFRDQEFSADMMARDLPATEAASARAVKRIDDVTALRSAQFPEDAGPMAHPIRPESYQEIGNFYTATVYEKGAEIIRMQHTLLGEEGFQAGMAEYFARHDGQAVTCDDFVDAMDSVFQQQRPGESLSVFRRWYSQAGTPQVNVTLDYDAGTRQCTVTLAQHCAPVGVEKLQNPPSAKPPLHIPFALGLLGPDGQAFTLKSGDQRGDTLVLDLKEQRQTWVFNDIDAQPVPSLLRGFSAPVIVDYAYTDNELALLARTDPEPFARWEAAQLLATRCLLAMAQTPDANSQAINLLVDTWRTLATDPALGAAYKARMFTLPGERILMEKMPVINPVAVAQARRELRARLGAALASEWQGLYQTQADSQKGKPYSPDPASAGARALQNCALSYLAAGNVAGANTLARAQYDNAGNMTDRMAGLSTLVNYGNTVQRETALASFYTQWQHNPLVIDRWFALQATAQGTDVATVRALMQHPAFTLRNPNRARSLVFQFCLNNLTGIYCDTGYDFWAEQVITLDALNPEIAARLSRAFDHWARLVPEARDAVKQRLERIQQHAGLSRNVEEIISKALSL